MTVTPRTELLIAYEVRANCGAMCGNPELDAQVGTTDVIVAAATVVPTNVPTAVTEARNIIYPERLASPPEHCRGAVRTCTCAIMTQELSGSLFLCHYVTATCSYCAMN